MKIFDISMKITPRMPVFKGNPSKRPVITVESDHTTGTVYESRIDMNLHTGTHLDAPLHMLANGRTIDELPLEKLVTRCRVLDLTRVEDGITAEDLTGKDIPEGMFVLLKTKNSFEEILEKDFIYVKQSGAACLRDRKVSGVGIDALGVERSQPGHETHEILLGSGIMVLEGLDLKAVAEGDYLLVAAPVCIAGAEAGPARALLLTLEASDLV